MNPLSDHDHDVQHGGRPGTDADRTQELPAADQTRPTPSVNWFGPDEAQRGPAGSGAPQGGQGSQYGGQYGEQPYGQYGQQPYGGQYGQQPQYGGDQHAGGQPGP